MQPYLIYLIGIAVVVVAIIAINVLRQQKKMNDLKDRARQGDAQAQYDLGCRFQEKKPSEAVELFKQAAEQGHANAQSALGEHYKEGKGIGKDIAQAIDYFHSAAAQGLAEGQYNLGLCYHSGEGVEQDSVKAAQWFEKAANQNYAKAQYELGVCYLRGDGVRTDTNKAIDWCKKAVENGSSAAEAIAGFKEVEQNRKLREERSSFIQMCGIELAKGGYSLGNCSTAKSGMNYGHAEIGIWNKNYRVGTMTVGTYGPEHTMGRSIKFILATEKIGQRNHIIHLDRAGVLIESDVHCSKPPPEWMWILALVLRRCFEVDYNPKLVVDYPETAKYVNVVFRQR